MAEFNQPTESEIIDSFRKFAAENGIELPDNVIADGKIHRFRLADEPKGKLSGAYKLYTDGRPAGFLQDFKSGLKENWKFTSENYRAPVLTPEQRAIQKQAFEHLQQQSLLEQQQAYNNAATQARKEWNNTQTAIEHPYLSHKGVKIHNARISVYKGVQQLIIPLQNKEGKLMSLQRININGIKEDGSPDFFKGIMKGSKKTDSFSILNRVENPEIIAIAEGFATTASVIEDNFAVKNRIMGVMAVDADNLKSVAQSMRELHPTATILVFADMGDHLNKGELRAKAAAKSVGGFTVLPPIEKGDMNDYLTGKAGKVTATLEQLVNDATTDATNNSLVQPKIKALSNKDIDEISRPIFSKLGQKLSEQTPRNHNISYQSFNGFQLVLEDGLDSTALKVSLSEVQGDGKTVFLNVTRHNRKFDDLINGQILKQVKVNFDGTKSGLSQAIELNLPTIYKEIGFKEPPRPIQPAPAEQPVQPEVVQPAPQPSEILGYNKDGQIEFDFNGSKAFARKPDISNTYYPDSNLLASKIVYVQTNFSSSIRERYPELPKKTDLWRISAIANHKDGSGIHILHEYADGNSPSGNSLRVEFVKPDADLLDDIERIAPTVHKEALKMFNSFGENSLFSNAIEAQIVNATKESAIKNLTAKLSTPEGITKAYLTEQANLAFGGSMADGKHTFKDAYDLMEAGVNVHLLNSEKSPSEFNAEAAAEKVVELTELVGKLPTQTVRDPEMDRMQQFSTPPALSYVANWVANVNNADTMLEPSAGTGDLAVWAKLAGAKVILNELSDRRVETLKTVFPEEKIFRENAEQLNNILPDEIKPTVIVMNPPFSTSVGVQSKNSTTNGAKHIEQALLRLADNGRLVAIVGQSMAADKPAFKEWWRDIQSQYNVRANIGIDEAFKKYGTSWGTQILVIDKNGSTTKPVLTGKVESVSELPTLLEDIKHERPSTTISNSQPTRVEPTRDNLAETNQADLRPQNDLGGNILDDMGNRSGIELGNRSTSIDARQSGNMASTLQSEQPPRTSDETADAIGQRGRTELRTEQRPAGMRDGADGHPSNESDSRIDRGDNGGINQSFLTAIDESSKNDILSSIAKHYGISIEQAYAEVTDVEAESILEYMVEPQRSATYVLMQKHRLELINSVKGTTDAKTPDQAEITDSVDSVFSNYTPQRLEINDAKPHPSKLVQSAAMASVEPPLPTYTPQLPQAVIKDGLLSLAQLEAVVYAGQAHNEILPNGSRKGFFIGDGTGVGKGREISGVILDNLMQGRKKAVWVSFSKDLIKDAQRDLSGVGGDPSLIQWHGQTKVNDSIKSDSGIVFTSYSTLSAESKQQATDKGQLKGGSRLNQLVDWLGKDFDGVIAFDEAHSMGNAITIKGKRGTTKPSKRALTGIALQKALPNARIVYVSATGATEVNNLAYADRLGLWGEGTAFSDVSSFVNEVSSGGVAAMELVSRDMKSLGNYISRSLSFDGVTYQRMEHDLTPLQTEVYNELATAWQTVLQNINSALETTDANRNSDAKGAALSAFWGAHQRFFNQVITSMQTPMVIDDIQKQLDSGNAAVIQIINTNEATQERELAKAAENGITLEELDFTPRQQLISYIENSFPVQQYNEVEDDEGNKVSVPTLDSKGDPVFNKEAIKMRDELINTLKTIRVPDNPIDSIINHFGSDIVAEVTGRSRRFVNGKDEQGEFKVIEEKRGQGSSQADAKAFQDDKKKILIFSSAGGTGFSFHADNTAINQRKRYHYILQAGWRADSAVQGFGRTHRTNQKQAPHYVLPTTSLKAQKRFISSVARRLDQLGALTRGQRQTTSQGLLTASDNLESPYARQAIYTLFQDMYRERTVAIGLNFHEVTREMGLDLIDKKTGAIKDEKIPTTTQFLNRLLSLTTHRQDQVFEAFEERLIDAVDHAKQQGIFDEGVQVYRAKNIEKSSDDVVFTEPKSGAQTRIVGLDVTNDVKYTDWKAVSAIQQSSIAKNEDGGFFVGLNGKLENKVFYLKDRHALINAEGKQVHRGTIYGISGQHTYIDNANEVLQGYKYGFVGTDGNRKYQQIPICQKITEAEAREHWAKELDVAPKTETTKMNILVGAILPIWDRINGKDYTIYRTQTDSGEQLLGRVLSEQQTKETLKNLGVTSETAKMSSADLFANVQNGNKAILANGWMITTATVNNETRLEIRSQQGKGSSFFTPANQRLLEEQGAFVERIQWQDRLFIPNNAAGFDVFTRITASKPVVEMIGDLIKSAEPEPTVAVNMGTVKNQPAAVDAKSAQAQEKFASAYAEFESYLSESPAHTWLINGKYDEYDSITLDADIQVDVDNRADLRGFVKSRLNNQDEINFIGENHLALEKLDRIHAEQDARDYHIIKDPEIRAEVDLVIAKNFQLSGEYADAFAEHHRDYLVATHEHETIEPDLQAALPEQLKEDVVTPELKQGTEQANNPTLEETKMEEMIERSNYLADRNKEIFFSELVEKYGWERDEFSDNGVYKLNPNDPSGNYIHIATDLDKPFMGNEHALAFSGKDEIGYFVNFVMPEMDIRGDFHIQPAQVQDAYAKNAAIEINSSVDKWIIENQTQLPTPSFVEAETIMTPESKKTIEPPEYNLGRQHIANRSYPVIDEHWSETQKKDYEDGYAGFPYQPVTEPEPVKAWMMTSAEFAAIATAEPLINHGRKWEVFAGGQSFGFTDSKTATEAIKEAHERSVNNALYSRIAENNPALIHVKEMPPAEVLAEYPQTVARFPELFPEFPETVKSETATPPEAHEMNADDEKRSNLFVSYYINLKPETKVFLDELTALSPDKIAQINVSVNSDNGYLALTAHDYRGNSGLKEFSNEFLMREFIKDFIATTKTNRDESISKFIAPAEPEAEKITVSTEATLRVTKKLANTLTNILDATGVDNSHEFITVHFSDPDYSHRTGGYHPVEISISNEGKINYVTDYTYFGRDRELVKDLDFDFESGRFQQLGMGDSREYDIRAGAGLFRTWQANFSHYHENGVFDVEVRTDKGIFKIQPEPEIVPIASLLEDPTIDYSTMPDYGDVPLTIPDNNDYFMPEIDYSTMPNDPAESTPQPFESATPEPENAKEPDETDTVVFSELKSIVLEWSEASDVKNREFQSFKDLQHFMIEEEYQNNPDNLPSNDYYHKHKISVRIETENGRDDIDLAIGDGLGRIDVGITEGDFNPFTMNLSEYIRQDYEVEKISPEGHKYRISIPLEADITPTLQVETETKQAGKTDLKETESEPEIVTTNETTAEPIKPWMMTSAEFAAIATTVTRPNYGWEVQVDGELYGIVSRSKAKSEADAIKEVHERAVDYACYNCTDEGKDKPLVVGWNTKNRATPTEIPPTEVLAEYPKVVENYPQLFQNQQRNLPKQGTSVSETVESEPVINSIENAAQIQVDKQAETKIAPEPISPSDALIKKRENEERMRNGNGSQPENPEPTKTTTLPDKEDRRIPPDVEAKYLQVENKFFNRKNPDVHVFEDKGAKIETKSNSAVVAGDLVKIAKERGWETIKINGTNEFRRDVWFEAQIRGIKTIGYTPTEFDKQLLAERKESAKTNSIELATFEAKKPDVKVNLQKPDAEVETKAQKTTQQPKTSKPKQIEIEM